MAVQNRGHLQSENRGASVLIPVVYRTLAKIECGQNETLLQ
jgi:hypothetical protein